MAVSLVRCGWAWGRSKGVGTLNISPEIILGIGGVLLLALVIIKLGRKIATFLLAAGGIVAVLVVVFAILDQAKATRQAAEAATVASTGQATASVGVTVLATLLVVVVIISGLALAYLTWRLRRAQRRAAQQPMRWRSGPNARWSREPRMPHIPVHPYGYYPAYPPQTAYPPYPVQAGGYGVPPHAYPGEQQPPSVVVVYDEDGYGGSEDPLDLPPLWPEDPESEAW